ncbi:MAG: hypothetical protein JNK38_05480, partial [Acidobacteria bacterium]|nr:hypothetical protein [Acidobacteriota bacterium]
MNRKTMFLSAALVLMLATLVMAADVTGKWTAQVPGRGGQTTETTFNFKVEGDKLTGTMSSQMGEAAISEGKVSGDDISFSVTREVQGNSFKIIYKGKVAGEEIKFTRTIEGRDVPPT